MLVHFARQIGVPFRVYGFSDSAGYRFSRDEFYYDTFQKDEIFMDQRIRLLELFSERMSKTEMVMMSKALLTTFLTRQKIRDLGVVEQAYGLKWYSGCVEIFQLGGTPLDAAIAIGINLAKDFRQANRIDILNTIFLTDGISHDMDFMCEAEDGKYARNLNDISWAGKDIYTTISHGNKTYRPLRPGRYYQWTETLYDIYRDATGSTNIGYRIIPNTTRALLSDLVRLNDGKYIYENTDEIVKQYRKEGYYRVQNAKGIDEQYLISIKSLTAVSSNLDNIEAGESKGKIRTAFKKSLGNSKKSRKMLNDLVTKVA